MKNNLRIFLVVGQLVATGYAGADSYAIFYLVPDREGGFEDERYLDEDYRAVAAVDSSDAPNPPDSTHAWVFWDVSSVGFKMGVPSEDFPSQFTATASIENAIDAWDDVESSVLSLTYDGLDVYLATIPKTG